MTQSPARLVVIGASAGGLSALSELLSMLPADFRTPVVIASHAGPGSLLLEALRHQTGIILPLRRATDGMPLEGPGVFVLPGARHGLVTGKILRLSEPVQNSGFRPSIDGLFMTAAASYGAGTVAVVLSGTMQDGMRGAQVIYDMGGRTVVQDPADADRADMPRAVINHDHPRAILPADGLGTWLADIAGG